MEVKAAKHIPGAVIHETGKYPGTRGWAAQWERIDIQLLPQEKWQGGMDNHLMLKNKPGSIPKIAEVKLQDQVYAEQDDDDDDEEAEDDEYWQSFLDIVDNFA